MWRFNGYNSISLQCILFICLLFISFPLAMSELRAFDCKNDSSYVHGSKYESNFKSVMDDLVKNAPMTGFNTSSHGEKTKEKVYGLLQCRKDASPQECSSCSQEASITVQQLCENDIGGRVWMDLCFLRYDNLSFFSDLDGHVSVILQNRQTVKDNPAGFQNDVMNLLRSLTGQTSDPANMGFAAESVASSSSHGVRIFGLVECWRDLPMEQCKSCLLIGLKKFYPTTVTEGGEAMLGSCRIRFEIYSFSKTLFAGNASMHQGRSPRVVVIICGSVGGGLLAFAICLFIIRKKIKRSTVMERSVRLTQPEREDSGKSGVVSCADILALAARDSVAKAGGPKYPVPLGRRDSVEFALHSVIAANLPAPTSNLTQLMDIFGSKGFSLTDLVALSGGHTIGHSHCGAFDNRLYDISTGERIVDPTLDQTFAKSLYKKCPVVNNTVHTTELDVLTPDRFDNKYYVDVQNKQALFTSDQTLYEEAANGGDIVDSFASNRAEFFRKFIEGMVKMGQLDVLTGSKGEIRSKCSVSNPTSAGHAEL